MEVKQEFSEDTCKIEILSNELDDAFLDFKNEIKEESNGDNTLFDDLNLNQFSLNTKVEDNIKPPFEEKQTKEKGFPQDNDTLEITKTIDIHLCNKKQTMRRSSEDKTLKAEISAKQISGTSSFNKYIKIQSGVKLYKCGICIKNFTHIADFDAHMTSHAGENMYKCDICFKQFSQTSVPLTHDLALEVLNDGN
ncbi:zinc finger protein 180-like isoform X2 [Diabrotica virgifera virgifera]|uniref:C2H2-type domain-containing protein n=1 Tax=Diabrotica virgifera virgifera TaxID=50390 RepID=A0ABM5KF82_DIAVI|nr:zinc finger protein 180-like isoform X2 [Diabrotica virgifera virgifera]